MAKILQLKQATISALTPTRYARLSDGVEVGYSVTDFGFKQALEPADAVTVDIGYSTIGFLMRTAIPPSSLENLTLGYSSVDFAFITHPDVTVEDRLSVGYSSTDFKIITHPNRDVPESITVGYSSVGFEYGGLAALEAPWDPRGMLETPQIILDDKSTVTDVSGFASHWNNRAPLAGQAVQAVAGNRPAIITDDSIGRRLLRFDGDSMTMTGVGDVLRGQGSGWMFVAIRKSAVDGSAVDRSVFMVSTNAAGASRLALWNTASAATGSDVNAVVPLIRRADGDTPATLTDVASIGSDWALYLAIADYSARTLTLYKNGVLEKTAAMVLPVAGITADTASSNVTIGAADSSGASPWLGDMACALMGRRVPSDSEIDRLFGYYANRLNLRALLPTTHPYKNNIPYPYKNVVELKFEGTNGSTTFTDEGGSVWTPTSATISTTKSKVGISSYYCAPNTSTGGLIAPYNYVFDLSVEDFCIQAWVYPEGAFSVNENGAVISRFGPNTNMRFWGLYRDQLRTRMVFMWGDGTAGEKTIVSADGTVPVDTWTHVAVTRRLNILKLYINGTLAATGTIVGNLQNNTTSSYLPRIGYSNHGPTKTAWGGYIDQLTLTRGDPLYSADFIPWNESPLPKDGVGLSPFFISATNPLTLIEQTQPPEDAVSLAALFIGATNPLTLVEQTQPPEDAVSLAALFISAGNTTP